MIENEASKKISNKQLLIDITLTRNEAEAFRLLSKGHLTLSTMPENTQGKRREHRLQSQNYNRKKVDCLAFLKRLEQLKEERKT